MGSQDYIRIFDTTLRDGEQSPGATLHSAEKLEVARALSRLGVDVLEAGFPAASPDDYAAVKAIAEGVGREPVAGRREGAPPIVCGLARATRADIDRAWEAVRPAARPRIHTFLATSEVHMRHKLRMTPEEVLAATESMVGHARSLCDDVEFSPEDASRSDRAFLCEVLRRAVRAGATTLNLPDTVGYATPDEMAALVTDVRTEVVGTKDVIISVHCHDDLGLAAANTLAALRAGARQAELTVNGIGERAGNASVEEVVMMLHTRADRIGLTTGIDISQICAVSRLVSERTGMTVAPNKAIVGANAFAHQSGIHQHGMMREGSTYEIIRPETVGATTRLVLGKLSGRHAFALRLEELGVRLEGEGLDRAFARFKALAERRKHLTDAELRAVAVEGGGAARAEAGVSAETIG